MVSSADARGDLGLLAYLNDTATLTEYVRAMDLYRVCLLSISLSLSFHPYLSVALCWTYRPQVNITLNVTLPEDIVLALSSACVCVSVCEFCVYVCV
jgi:hypothetical protein